MVADTLVIGAFAFVFGFLVASSCALHRWRGLWRWLALIPLGVLAIVVIRILIRPEAHNLWPFEIMLWSGGCALGLAALCLIRRLIVPPNVQFCRVDAADPASLCGVICRVGESICRF